MNKVVYNQLSSNPVSPWPRSIFRNLTYDKSLERLRFEKTIF